MTAVRARLRVGAVDLALAVLLGLTIGGVAGAGEGTIGAPADSATGALPPDLEEAAAEMDRADQPLPQRDLATVVAAATAGHLSWRTAAAGGKGRHEARLGLSGGPVVGRAVLRLRPGEPADLAGGVGVGRAAWRLWAGQLVLRHGLGLTAEDPARRASPAADGPLGHVTGGLATRATAGGGLRQAGLTAARGRWHLEVLAACGRGPGARGTWWARGGRADPSGSSWAVLAGSDSLGTRLSAAGHLARPSLGVDWELAAVPAAGTAVPLAAAAGFSWQPAPGLRLEAMSAAGRGMPSARCAVLPGGADRGWAVRLYWRERGAGALALLLQGAVASPSGDEPLRRHLGVQEVCWERQAPGGIAVHLRCRRSSRRETRWSERAPWLPGREGPQVVRTLMTAGIGRQEGRHRLGMDWRAFAVSGGADPGTRQTLSLSARRAGGPGREIRLEATTAWGDPVDLVQAITPIPGLVVPRHWGRWRSELVIGGSFAWGPLQLRAAVARRLPEAMPMQGLGTAQAAQEGWIEARRAW